jgi:RNA polymerase sigma factor (sigma-70 family)
MTCSALPPVAEGTPSRLPDRFRTRALGVLAQFGAAPEAIPGFDTANADAALATALMDLFRRTGENEVFECLVEVTSAALLGRVRLRLRGLGRVCDAHEVLQDAFVNIYRYPDRFAASRPGAFAAWATTIVDNAIRRQLRRRSGPPLSLTPTEVLSQHPDRQLREPAQAAEDHEACAAAASAFGLLLAAYQQAFAVLSPRERFVLEQVEVAGRRYADLAQVLGIRPEALKMVVFRARKRIYEKLLQWFGGAAAAAA